MGCVSDILSVMAAIWDFAFDQHVTYLGILKFVVTNENIFDKKGKLCRKKILGL